MKIKMDFVSSQILNEKTQKDRIEFILRKIQNGSIVVTDAALHPNEEMDLIKTTMRKVDDGFPGIEVCSLKKKTKGLENIFERVSDQTSKLKKLVGTITGREMDEMNLRSGLTVIGPARIVKKIKKNPDSFSISAEA